MPCLVSQKNNGTQEVRNAACPSSGSQPFLFPNLRVCRRDPRPREMANPDRKKQQIPIERIGQKSPGTCQLPLPSPGTQRVYKPGASQYILLLLFLRQTRRCILLTPPVLGRFVEPRILQVCFLCQGQCARSQTSTGPSVSTTDLSLADYILGLAVQGLITRDF